MSFVRALRGVDKAIKQGVNRALNRALKSSRTKLVKEIKSGTSLKTDDVNARIRQLGANKDKQDIALLIATKIGVPIRKFSPREKRVRTSTGNKKAVTAKIGANRQLVPGGFMVPVSGSNEIVAIRKNQSDSYSETTQPRTKIFTEVSESVKGDVHKHMHETFIKNVNHEIEFALKRKFSSTK
jgi:hypothetical protein